MAEEKELSDTQKENYERLLFAIAVYFSSTLGVDIKKVESYKDLTEGQRTFARKIYEEHRPFKRQVEATERLDETSVIKDVAQVAQTQGNAKMVRWVTVGDDRVCPKCAAWQGRILHLDDGMHPNVSDAIAAGGLHFACRCSLQELGTSEIPIKEPNPRRDDRMRVNPSIFNTVPTSILVMN